MVVKQASKAKALEALLDKSLKNVKYAKCTVSEWMFIPRPSNKADYQLMLVHSIDPFNMLFGSSAASMLVIVDPAVKNKLPKNKVQERYSFTDREVDVAQALLLGQSAKEIASELDLTYESTRWYVKQVCQKAGIRKQTEFIAKVLSEFSLIL